jgi:hypothetical protein
MNVLGIDLSSRAIDLVLLNENHDQAEWVRVELEGSTAFERARDVAEKMPTPSWYDNHGVYLVAVERPFSQSRNDTIRLIQGCVLSAIPRRLDVLEVAPQTWKAHIGFKGKGKPVVADFPNGLQIDARLGSVWDWRNQPIAQDCLDALGCALWARDTNADLIANALAQ